MGKSVFCSVLAILMLLIAADLAFAQDESAEDIEMPLLDDEGNLRLFIRAKKIDSLFNIVVKGHDDEYSGYSIQDISVFIPQEVENETRIMLVQAKKALYVSELQFLEISEKAVMYMLPKVYGQKYQLNEQNLINYDLRIKTEKLTVRWIQEEMVDSGDKPRSVPEVTSQEKVVVDYPQQGISFKGTGFTFREGSKYIKIHKDVEVSYFQSLNRESVDLDNESANSFKLTGTKGADINFYDAKGYKLKSIVVTGAVRFIQQPQNSQLSCKTLNISLKDGADKELVFEKIVAEGDVSYLTPNRFNLNCEKLEIFYENENNTEKFLGIFTGIQRVIIFTDNAKELFGTASEDKENLFTYYLCHADDKIIFEREYNSNSEQEVCGFEKWRFLNEAKIERKIVRLNISEIDQGELIDKASFLEGRKIPGKIESTQVDMVLQGKEEISFYFELQCKSDLLAGEETISRSLTRLEVKNSQNRSTLEFYIENLGNVHIFAEGLIFVQKSETESHLSITGFKPSMILKTTRDLRFTTMLNESGNLFRYILTAESSIFVTIKYNPGYAFENLSIVSKEGIEIRKTPLRLTQAAVADHYSVLKAFDVEIIFALNRAGDLELREFTAHSSPNMKILYEISDNRIETEYLKYNSTNLPYDALQIDDEVLPNWKLIYEPYKTTLTLSGKTTLKSCDQDLNKLVSINNKDGKNVIPSTVILNADKKFEYTVVYLRNREKLLTLNNNLELGEKIEVSVYELENRLLYVKGKNLVLDSERDLRANSVNIRKFNVSGESADKPAILEYEYRDLFIRASQISISGENADVIEMTGAPTISFTISNVQTIDETGAEKSELDKEVDYKINVQFPETDDPEIRKQQKIVALGFIDELKITSRCEINVSEKNTPENMLRMQADEVNALFSRSKESKSELSLEISKIVASGNVLISDGKREVNGEKLIWDTAKGVSIKLEGDNSVLSEKREGKEIYIIKGINSYEFRDESENVKSRRNVIKLKSKQGIKIRVNR